MINITSQILCYNCIGFRNTDEYQIEGGLEKEHSDQQRRPTDSVVGHFVLGHNTEKKVGRKSISLVSNCLVKYKDYFTLFQ